MLCGHVCCVSDSGRCQSISLSTGVDFLVTEKVNVFHKIAINSKTAHDKHIHVSHTCICVRVYACMHVSVCTIHVMYKLVI